MSYLLWRIQRIEHNLVQKPRSQTCGRTVEALTIMALTSAPFPAAPAASVSRCIIEPLTSKVERKALHVAAAATKPEEVPAARDRWLVMAYAIILRVGG